LYSQRCIQEAYGGTVSGALPDTITIYGGPLERLYGHEPELLTRQIRRVVLHEVAHHFGISDERLIDIDRSYRVSVTLRRPGGLSMSRPRSCASRIAVT
jgi:predicted Zn-dependent protease with MMP-like domain